MTPEQSEMMLVLKHGSLEQAYHVWLNVEQFGKPALQFSVHETSVMLVYGHERCKSRLPRLNNI